MKTVNEAFRTLKERGIIDFDKDVSDELKISKSTISEYLKGTKPPSANFIKMFNEHYKKFGVQIDPLTRALFKTKGELIGELENSKRTKSEFDKIVDVLTNQGHTIKSEMFDNKQIGTLLLLIASEVSFLSSQWQYKERMDPDEARKLIREQMRKIETVL